MDMSPLISGSFLHTLAKDTSIRFLDATTALPGETFDPLKRFHACHIPGSQYFDINVFSDPQSSLPHTVPSAARFAHLFGALVLRPKPMWYFTIRQCGLRLPGMVDDKTVRT